MPSERKTHTVQAVLILAALTVALAGCGTSLSLRDALRGGSPHDQYARSLRRTANAELARAWTAAADAAIAAPVGLVLPFGDVAFVAADEPAAVAYRVDLRRGQRLTIAATQEGLPAAGVFIDAFALGAGGDSQRIASSEAAVSSLGFDAPHDGSYVLRLQPELFRGGRYHVEGRVTASIGFPVAGADSRAVGSAFGVTRDAGLREHHGIDIFAPRGTPVLSATDGRVTRVDTTGRGGRVVWVWDAQRRASVYYAHLDQQHVTGGQAVRAGDQLGTVGNTGNARGTPPHLHFGIYARRDGPIDPYPYVHEPRTQPRTVTASLDPLGRWGRTTGAGYRLRGGASTSAPILEQLPRHAVLHVDGALADWYRVTLPDGTRGFVTARAVEPFGSPVEQRRTPASTIVRVRPAGGPTVASLPPDIDVPVLGSWADYLLVRTPDGREGWASFE